MPASRSLEADLRLVRPMLELSRSEVLEYLESLGQGYRIDDSNSDETYTRNRLRHALLPQLERDFNPRIRDALRRLGRQAAEVEAALDACALDCLERALESVTPCECRLKWQVMSREPRHLVRATLSALWRRQGWPRQAMTFDHWDRLADIVLQGGAGDFPAGIEARRDGRLCVIGRPRP